MSKNNVSFFRSAKTACEAAGIPVDPDTESIEQTYPVLVNSYYLSLMNPELGKQDPVYRQWHPSPMEMDDFSSSTDPLAEVAQSPAPRLIRRYRDRVVLLVTGKCAMRCRFCFRKRTWTTGTEMSDISDEQLQGAADYLRRTPEIHEVLVSGGDALFLPPERIEKILDTLTAIPNIEIIRMASRLPAVLPDAVTDEKIRIMKKCPCLWLATHFNHPQELSEKAMTLCRRIAGEGIPIVNQTVLLKGINDNPETLETLFRTLVKNKVKPLYLFHVDPVRGVRHFATGIEKGLEILRAFRPRLSSLAVPQFAIDLPEGGGKVNLQPDYSKDGKFPDLKEEHWIKYETDHHS